MRKPMIVILGPTATGKTRIAALLASRIDGEVISADSRQVYRGMDIGTGKDMGDYIVNGREVRSHLVNIAEAGEKYSIFRYKEDFDKAYIDITDRDKYAVVCGGSGMYLETALGLYDLKNVPENVDFRNKATGMSEDELINQLKSFRPLHNSTDLTDRNRLVRALEIAQFETHVGRTFKRVENVIDSNPTVIQSSEAINDSKLSGYDYPPRTSYIYGIDTPREIVRARVTDRLKKRLDEGMINEVKELVNKGVSFETLYYYGLEYRYIALYLEGKLSFDEMFRQLNTAIHQFAKRQLTWFRRMERRGIHIKWLKNDPDSVVHSILRDLEVNESL